MGKGKWELEHPAYPAMSSGAWGSGWTIFVNWPRWSSSRPLPPRPVTSVLRRADRLLGAAARLDGQQVAIAGRGDEPEHAVRVGGDLDQDHAAARARQEVDLVHPRQHRARLARRGNQDLVARHARDADELRAVRRPRVAPSGTGARLDERLEAEPQAVAVARHGHGVHRRHVPFLLRRDVADDAFVEAEGGDDALAVLQLEEALDRLAVAGGGGNIGDA